MKRVLFRADAMPSIGTGDLVSLIHLSRYFEKKGWLCSFLIRDYPAGVTLAGKFGLQDVDIIPRDILVEDEVATINRIVEEKKIDLLFFEITQRPLTEYIGIMEGVKKACISFDGKILPDMDLVIDWDVAAADFFEPELYPRTKFLLGPEYVILPLSFDGKIIGDRRFRPKAGKLLICMGGADEFNYTQRVVDILIEYRIRMEVVVILGAGYGFHGDLEHTLTGSGLGYKIKQNVSNMFQEYMECDVAIGAGGLISSELVATRTPSILIATYRHQMARCEYFKSRGWVHYLGYRDFSGEELVSCIEKPREPGEQLPFDTWKIMERVDELL